MHVTHDSVILYFNKSWVRVFATESLLLLHSLILVSSHSTANTQLLKRENDDIRFQKFKRSTFRVWLINHQLELLNQSYFDIHSSRDSRLILFTLFLNIRYKHLHTLTSITSQTLYALWRSWKRENLKSWALMLRSFFIAMYKNLWCFESDRSVNLLHERKTTQQSSFQSLTTLSVSATELWSEKEENLQRRWQTKSHKKMKAPKKIKTEVNERDKRRRDERWEMKEMKQ